MSLGRLSVILPCFNEEDNVALWEQELFPLLDCLPFPSECLIVDDGSTDGTAATAQELCDRRPELRLLRHSANRGLGAAIRTGLAAAGGDAVITLDADLTFAPSVIPRMVEALEPGVDCVCASPFLGAFAGVGPLRRWLGASVNLLYRRLLGRPLTSVSSICRLYRASAVRNLALASNSFDINAEVIFELLRAGRTVVEVPAVLAVRRHGASKLSMAREIRNHLIMFARILRWRAFGAPGAGGRSRMA